MLKILVVGDLHLSSRSPASRIDDYALAGLNKLKQVGKIAIENKVQVIMFSGDFFNIREQPWQYYNLVQDVLGYIKHSYESSIKKSVDIFTIVGNLHDIPYDKFELLDKTPLGGLIKSGIIQLLDRVVYNEIELVGQSIGELSVGTFKKPVKKKSVLVLHAFYMPQFDDPYFILEETLDELGYSYAVLGHDHTPYAPIKTKGGCTVIRPGALLRGSSHHYQLAREVWVYILSLGEKDSVEGIKLNIKPSELIFSNRSINKDVKDKFSMEKAMQFVESIMKKVGKSKISVYSVLDELNLSLEVRSYIESKFKEIGIYRSN